MDLFRMIWGLIWYHSRGHTTKIDTGKRSRLKKKQKLVRECPFEIIGFTCWPKFWESSTIPQRCLISNIIFIRPLEPQISFCEVPVPYSPFWNKGVHICVFIKSIGYYMFVSICGEKCYSLFELFVLHLFPYFAYYGIPQFKIWCK